MAPLLVERTLCLQAMSGVTEVEGSACEGLEGLRSAGYREYRFICFEMQQPLPSFSLW